MFTFGAIALLAIIGWCAHRANEKDREKYDRASEDQRIWLLLLHIRQDVKLMIFLMGGLFLALNIVIDIVRR